METLITMSAKELNRAEILGRVIDKRLSQVRAAELLSMTDRQVRRLLERYKLNGAAGIASKRRGRPSNRLSDQSVRARAIAIVRERYVDFGPTLACEKLREAHGLSLSVETMRKWMTAEGMPDFS